MQPGRVEPAPRVHVLDWTRPFSPQADVPPAEAHGRGLSASLRSGTITPAVAVPFRSATFLTNPSAPWTSRPRDATWAAPHASPLPSGRDQGGAADWPALLTHTPPFRNPGCVGLQKCTCLHLPLSLRPAAGAGGARERPLVGIHPSELARPRSTRVKCTGEQKSGRCLSCLLGAQCSLLPPLSARHAGRSER